MAHGSTIGDARGTEEEDDPRDETSVMLVSSSRLRPRDRDEPSARLDNERTRPDERDERRAGLDCAGLDDLRWRSWVDERDGRDQRDDEPRRCRTTPDDTRLDDATLHRTTRDEHCARLE